MHVIKRLAHQALSIFRNPRARGPEQSSGPFQRLPPELQLLCFSFLTVESLITSASVCTSWRRRIPQTDMHPVRRRLYNLYRTMMDNPRPADPLSARYLQRHLDRSFDRQAYLDAMRGQELNNNGDDAVNNIPEEFSVWVREWPDRLVVNGIWPGLPHTECLMDTLATGGAARRFGENFIALRPPVVAPMREERPEGSGVIVKSAVIPIWLSSWPVPEERIRMFVNTSSKELSALYYGPDSSPWYGETWLVVDDSSRYFGKVLECPPNYKREGGTMSTSGLGRPPASCPDWIRYLEMRWFGVAPSSSCGRELERPNGVRLPSFMADSPLRRNMEGTHICYLDYEAVFAEAEVQYASRKLKSRFCFQHRRTRKATCTSPMES